MASNSTSSHSGPGAATTASLSLHVLDTTRGRPGSNMRVQLDAQVGEERFESIGAVSTDANGRAPRWEQLKAPHTYRLTFATADYFATQHQEKTFYPHVRVLFEVQPGEHYHVPLLVSAFGYSTYRGN
jgi:hydroxyisourate hydrolase